MIYIICKNLVGGVDDVTAFRFDVSDYGIVGGGKDWLFYNIIGRDYADCGCRLIKPVICIPIKILGNASGW